MSAPATLGEGLLVLSAEHLAAGTAVGALPPLERELVHAALRGDETLLELHRRLLADGRHASLPTSAESWVDALRASPGPVQVVPHPRRFAYGWVALATGATSADVREALRDAIAAADVARPGLLLSIDDLGVLPPHVEAYPPAALDRRSIAEPCTLVQVARAVLRTMPATRVLVCGESDAILVADVLDRHVVAVVTDGTTWDRARAPARRSAPRALLALLAAGAPPESLRRFAPDWTARMREVLALGEPSTLRAAGAPSVVAWSAASAASFLTPGASSAPITRRSSETSEPSLDVRTIGDRDPSRSPRRVAFSSFHLLGDSLAATAVLRSYRARNPEDHLTFLVPDAGYARIFELCPGVDRIAYLSTPGDDQVVFRASRPLVESLEWWRATEFDARYVLDVQEAARDGAPPERGHMAQALGRLAGLEVQDTRPWIDAGRALEHRPSEAPHQPYVVFARHTVSGRHVRPDDRFTKRWAERKWRSLARWVRRELGLSVVSIGTAGEARLGIDEVLELHGLDIRAVAGLLAGARALVTVDNGIFHLALALGVPLVHLQPDWLPASWTRSATGGPFRDLRARLPRLSVRKVQETLLELLGSTAARGA